MSECVKMGSTRLEIKLGPCYFESRNRCTAGMPPGGGAWSTSSFTSYHGQLLSLAVQWGVAIEIERAIKKSARFC